MDCKNPVGASATVFFENNIVPLNAFSISFIWYLHLYGKTLPPLTIIFITNVINIIITKYYEYYKIILHILP